MMELVDIVLGAVTQPALHTLANFLWQGLLVAVLLAAVLLLFRPRNAQSRYRLACWALVLMVVLPMATGTRFVLSETGILGRTSSESGIGISAHEAGLEDDARVPWETVAAVKQMAQAIPLSESTSGLAGSLWRTAVLRAEDPQTGRWILAAWLCGVFLLSGAHLGG